MSNTLNEEPRDFLCAKMNFNRRNLVFSVTMNTVDSVPDKRGVSRQTTLQGPINDPANK